MRKIVVLLLPLLVLVAGALACVKTPDYKLRGWTVTPSVNPATATLPPPPTSTPIIIYVTPTSRIYDATIITDTLTIRSGPNGVALPTVYLRRGDIITILSCQYDSYGEAWVNFWSDKYNLGGWAGVTWRGIIYMSPMPGDCQ